MVEAKVINSVASYATSTHIHGFNLILRQMLISVSNSNYGQKLSKLYGKMHSWFVVYVVGAVLLLNTTLELHQ